MKGLFVTGSDTEVGKTTVSCLLIRTLRTRFDRVAAYKPAASGIVDLLDSDVYRLWEASGKLHSIDRVCQHRFRQAVAPSLAASGEGMELSDEQLIAGAISWENDCDCLVIEGAGGLLSPMTLTSSNADLAVKMGLPVVLVVAHRIGAVNQCMLVFEAAANRELDVAAIVLNEAMLQPDFIRFEDHIQMIRQALAQRDCADVPIMTVGHDQSSLMDPDGKMPRWLEEAFPKTRKST
jgi:dethiobiotin synthetase